MAWSVRSVRSVSCRIDGWFVRGAVLIISNDRASDASYLDEWAALAAFSSFAFDATSTHHGDERRYLSGRESARRTRGKYRTSGGSYLPLSVLLSPTQMRGRPFILCRLEGRGGSAEDDAAACCRRSVSAGARLRQCSYAVQVPFRAGAVDGGSPMPQRTRMADSGPLASNSTALQVRQHEKLPRAIPVRRDGLLDVGPQDSHLLGLEG